MWWIPLCNKILHFDSFLLFFSENLESQTLHLNGFTPSWTHATCFLKSLFKEKLFVTNLTFEFFLSCTDSICLTNLYLKGKLLFLFPLMNWWNVTEVHYGIIIHSYKVRLSATLWWIPLCHKICTVILFCYSLVKIWSHKLYIWMVLCPHELMQHVF